MFVKIFIFMIGTSLKPHTLLSDWCKWIINRVQHCI